MDAYAGYYFDEKKLRESSSGGAATAISEAIIKDGGIVYGATYSEDFHSAVYGSAEKEHELQKFKGSKYVYVSKKFIKNGKVVSVYEEAIADLKQGRIVLFTGLGCDIAALKGIAEKVSVNTEKLFTIELLCDGVTNQIVHEEYVSGIEEMYHSKVTAFSVRYKQEGWVPLYIYAKFENGEEHIQPFYGSDYGFAFLNYKRNSCYDCQFKNEKHYGDVMVADFWGCRPGMEEYNPKGVSLIYKQTEKGNILLDYLRQSFFFLKRIDLQYALYYSPRYTTSHERYHKWDAFDKIIHTHGLREAVRVCSDISMPEHFKNKQNEGIVLWGTGVCFQRYILTLSKIVSIQCVIDSNQDKWGKKLAGGFICQSPESIRNMKNIVVLIMIENTGAALQVANKLLDMGITEFDHISNWLCYSDF